MGALGIRWRRGGLALLAVATLGSGCALFPDRGAPEPPPREEAGPTLGAQAPSEWKVVRHTSGLQYSVPPEWDIVAEDQQSADDAGGGTPPDDSLDWGFGIVTTANAEAQRDYCSLPGVSSFRARVGITEPVAGEAESVTASMARTMGSSMDYAFSEHGSEVDVGEAEKIGVSGTLAYHQHIEGTPNEPRSICTPPTIRADVIGVSMGSPDEPKTVSLLLMSDEDEDGVESAEVIDTVLGSLRFDNSL